MRGDKECEDHNCEALPFCSWHPDECMGKPWAKREEPVDIRKVMAIYRKRLAVFKREMAALGIKVKVTASFGKWTSTVEVEE